MRNRSRFLFVADSLEERLALVSTLFSSGVLTLSATQFGERIVLSTSTPFDNKLYLAAGGQATAIQVPGGAGSNNTLLMSQVSVIKIVGSGGNDDLQVNGNNYAGKTIEVRGGDGNDQISVSANTTAKLYGDAGDDWIFSGSGNDNLQGGAGKDVISAGGGNDDIDAGDGDDTCYGGSGNDKLTGGIGADQLFGEDGDDTLDGNDGNDLLYGGPGSDTIHGNAGDDDLDGCDRRHVSQGGATDDGANPDDFLYGDEGRDVVSDTGTGNDTLDGGAGRDFLYGGRGNDHLSGGDDNDDLHGETGDDVLDGGNGDDKYFMAAPYGMNQSADWGHDTVHETGGKPVNSGYDGGDGLILGSSRAITFDLYADRVAVTDGTNTVNVDNTLLEYFLGGPGNDTFNLHPGNAAYVLSGNDGQDTIDYHAYFSSVNVELGSRLIVEAGYAPYYVGRATNTRLITMFENAVGGTGDDVLRGTPLANILVGNMGNDRLYGLEGDDTLHGYQGNDLLDGGKGSDKYLFAGSNLGRDTLVENGVNVDHDLLDFSGFVSVDQTGVLLSLATGGLTRANPGNIEFVTKAGGFEEAIGSNYDDTILGGPGNDILRGGGGNDTLGGGGGTNVLEGGGGTNVLHESADANFTLRNGSLAYGIGSSTFSGISKVVLVDGRGSHKLDAATYSGAAEFHGGGGNDTFLLGTGATFIDGGTGNDTYVFAAAAAAQTVSIDEGDGGVDRLDFSALAADDPLAVDLAAPDGLVAAHRNRTVRIVGEPRAVIEQVIGGAGDDRLVGSGAANLIVGSAGDDQLTGAAGNDDLRGDVGDDTYLFADGWGSDKIADPDGAVAGGSLDFSAATLALKFAVASAAVTVTSGKNKLVAPNAFLDLRGGAADDLFLFADAAQLAAGAGRIHGSGGRNTLDYAAYTTSIVADLTARTATGTAHIDGIAHVFGGRADDLLTGDATDNTLKGNGGNDRLFGDLGSDTLDGGAGSDTADGGADADVDVAVGVESPTRIP